MTAHYCHSCEGRNPEKIKCGRWSIKTEIFITGRLPKFRKAKEKNKKWPRKKEVKLKKI
jgi:hypothetical protein